MHGYLYVKDILTERISLQRTSVPIVNLAIDYVKTSVKNYLLFHLWSQQPFAPVEYLRVCVIWWIANPKMVLNSSSVLICAKGFLYFEESES